MNAVRDGNHIRIYNAFMIKESIKEIDGLMEDDDQQEQHEPEEPLIPMPIKVTPYQHQIRAYNFALRLFGIGGAV